MVKVASFSLIVHPKIRIGAMMEVASLNPIVHPKWNWCNHENCVTQPDMC